MDQGQARGRLADAERHWDVIVIGGGASGLGVAVDAAQRGYDTLLVEQSDFAKGTSSRSTKLVHGGVRYLQQGDVGLVTEALRERGRLLANAPHLVFRKAFIVPTYRWWGRFYYGFGLKLYDRLAGELGMGRSIKLSREETIEHLPTVRQDGLRGGVLYYDGQFDDARLALALARTAVSAGASVINYARVEGLLREGDRLCGARIRDLETDEAHDVKGRVVINATGIFADRLRQMDDPEAKPLMATSQGVHLVFDRAVLPTETALLVPRTDDGRVVFAVPWHGKVLVGTTDTPVDEPELEPLPLEDEVEFILEHVRRYLSVDVQRSDVRSVYTGIRPLVRRRPGATSKLSRTHQVRVSDSGLVSICGGKWTTYRQMAEDTVDRAIEVGDLTAAPCGTAELPLHGWTPDVPEAVDHWSLYGSDGPAVKALCATDADWNRPLHARLPYLRGEVVWAARHEMARTVDDVLARRTRALVMDAEASVEVAGDVAALMAAELGRDAAWIAGQVETFAVVADGYRPSTPFA